jgi:hypothetical protein
MGRGRWTDRLTVEECFAFDIGNLVRAGAFEAGYGVPCSTTWNDSLGNAIWRQNFRVFPDQTGALAVHFYHPVPATLCTPARVQRQTVQVVTTRCNFGGVRRWFKCALVKDGHLCKRRVRFLYSTPHERLFGCRKCHDLTYESAQKHDKRVDLLLKLPPQEFNNALATGNLRRRLLASRALTKLLQRLARKADAQETPQSPCAGSSCKSTRYGRSGSA